MAVAKQKQFFKILKLNFVESSEQNELITVRIWLMEEKKEQNKTLSTKKGDWEE